MKGFPRESVDLVLADPPYGVNSNELNGIDYKDEFYNVGLVSTELYRISKNNSRALCLTAQKTLTKVVSGFEENGFKLHQTLIWYRPNLVGGTKKENLRFYFGL